MNETVLDVLMYLFENFSDQEYTYAPDQMALRKELLQAGFNESEVDRALDWLEELAANDSEPFAKDPAKRSVRLFNAHEMARLDVESRGYVVYLEQIGILSPVQREVVLDRNFLRTEIFLCGNRKPCTRFYGCIVCNNKVVASVYSPDSVNSSC